MKPINIIIIAVVAVCALFVAYTYTDGDLFGGLSSIIDTGEDPIDATSVDYSKFDLWMLICHLSGKTLDQQTTYDYIDRLNMKPYGSMNEYDDVYEEFSIHYTEKGWTYYGHDFMVYPNGNGALLILTKGTDVAFLFSATTDAIQAETGYNTLSVTAEGPFYAFQSFLNFIDSS